MFNLNTKLIMDLQFGFPPKQEQIEIVRRVNELDALIDSESLTLSKYQLVKRALMDDLLSGRIRVPDLSSSSLLSSAKDDSVI